MLQPPCTTGDCFYHFGWQDDDSDLEYELEASPAVSSEASAEAAACVKVIQTMIA